MTKAKRWPNNAEWARLDSIAEADQGIRALEPVLEEERMTQSEMIRRVAQAMNALHGIVRRLQAVGPGKNER